MEHGHVMSAQAIETGVVQPSNEAPVDGLSRHTQKNTDE
jgi:hypothetical protein